MEKQPFDDFVIYEKAMPKTNIYGRSMINTNNSGARYNNDNGSCNYRILFKNGRILSFKGFAVLDMNNIRNMLYDIKIISSKYAISMGSRRDKYRREDLAKIADTILLFKNIEAKKKLKQHQN